jgi:eukaryotic-like serine/threonine-protein kinase
MSLDDETVGKITGSPIDDALISLQPQAPILPRQQNHGATALMPGDLLANRFRILRYIARGGMGEVYEAEDLELGVHIALKTVMQGDLAQIRQEVQTARLVTHPNVCRIFDIAQHKNQDAPGEQLWFITMELLQGRSLAQEIAQKEKLGPDAARFLVTQLAAGLEAIHSVGIVHGDFKTSNVLLIDQPNGKVRAVITDFGLAVQGAAADQASGAGTPLYMAPEQVQRGAVTPQTDIYSLGVVIYEMVTGNWPFVAATAEGTARKRLTEKPVPPARYAPDLPPIWNRTILRCLAVEPKERFAHASEVARELRVRRFYESRWFRISAAALLSVAAIVVTARQNQWGPFHQPSSVAVVGWRNSSGDAQYDWVSGEISDQLTDLLARSNALSVIPQEEVSTARLENMLGAQADLDKEDLSPLRAALNGSLLVFGSYQVRSGTVYLHGELQDASGGILLTLDENAPLDDLATLSARLAQKLTPKLQLPALSPKELAQIRQIYPADPEARSLYFDAVEKLRSFRVVEARDLLQKSADLDNSNVAVHLSLAESWALLRFDTKARDQADQAVKLARSQDLLPEYVSFAEARQAEFDGRWTDAANAYGELNHFYPNRPEYLLHYTEALITADKPAAALEHIDHLKPREQEPIGQAALDLLRAEAYQKMGDFQHQLAFGEKSREAARKNNQRLQEALALKENCWAELNLSRAPSALQDCQQAQSIFSTYHDTVNATVVLNSIAVMYRVQNEYPQAEATLMNVVNVVRDAGSQIDLAGALLNLADVQLQIGDDSHIQSAEVNLRQSLEISQRIEDKSDAVRAQIALASVLQQTSESAARELLVQALEGARQLGDPDLQAFSLSNLGDLALDTGDLKNAESSLQQALVLRQTMHESSGIAMVKQSLGDIARRRGQADEALRDYNDARDIFDRLGQEANSASVWVQIGALSEDRGNYSDALAKARGALEKLQHTSALESQADALLLAARAEVGIHDFTAAQQSLQQVRALKMVDPHVLEQIDIADALIQGMSGNSEQAVPRLQHLREQDNSEGNWENALEAGFAVLQLEVASGNRHFDLRKDAQAFDAEARRHGFENLVIRSDRLTQSSLLSSTAR